MTIFFEEGKDRRFMSCDKAADDLVVLMEKHNFPADAEEKFWQGYRWQPPETKNKAMRK